MSTDPFNSLDSAVRLLAEQYREASERVERFRAHLMVYADGQSSENTCRSLPVSAEEHYGFDESADCGCSICADWETRRAEFVAVASLVPKGHKWTVCGCDSCRFVGRFQMNLLAATNRRDLLIEMSFHARFHSLHGERIMEWFHREIRDPSYTDNWCAQEMSRYPVERWLMKCNMAVSGSVGGPVFQDSARRIDFVERSSSSLEAVTDLMVIG